MVEALRRARPGRQDGARFEFDGRAGRYDRSGFPELFDGVVISGDVGMHRPQPEIFLLEAERVGAVAVGMTAVLHRGAESTLPQREELLAWLSDPRKPLEHCLKLRHRALECLGCLVEPTKVDRYRPEGGYQRAQQRVQLLYVLAQKDDVGRELVLCTGQHARRLHQLAELSGEPV